MLSLGKSYQSFTIDSKLTIFSSRIWCLHYYYYRKFPMSAEINNYIVVSERNEFCCVLSFLPVSPSVFLIRASVTHLFQFCAMTDWEIWRKQSDPQLQFKTPVCVWEHRFIAIVQTSGLRLPEKWSGLENIIFKIISSGFSQLRATTIEIAKVFCTAMRAGWALSCSSYVLFSPWLLHSLTGFLALFVDGESEQNSNHYSNKTERG